MVVINKSVLCERLCASAFIHVVKVLCVFACELTQHYIAHTQVGEAKAAAAQEGQPAFKKGVYFLGKVLWAKGYTELLDRMNEHEQRTGQHVPVDVYGNGPDAKVCFVPSFDVLCLFH